MQTLRDNKWGCVHFDVLSFLLIVIVTKFIDADNYICSSFHPP